MPASRRDACTMSALWARHRDGNDIRTAVGANCLIESLSRWFHCLWKRDPLKWSQACPLDRPGPRPLRTWTSAGPSGTSAAVAAPSTFVQGQRSTNRSPMAKYLRQISRALRRPAAASFLPATVSASSGPATVTPNCRRAALQTHIRRSTPTEDAIKGRSTLAIHPRRRL